MPAVGVTGARQTGKSTLVRDLLIWRSGMSVDTEVRYWRTTAGEEGHLVVETEGQVLPIEIRTSTEPMVRDAANLLAFQAKCGPSSRAGLLLHTGEDLRWLTPTVLAAPLWKLI